jgi:hypothetical protein
LIQNFIKEQRLGFYEVYKIKHIKLDLTDEQYEMLNSVKSIEGKTWRNLFLTAVLPEKFKGSKLSDIIRHIDEDLYIKCRTDEDYYKALLLETPNFGGDKE